jgi:hypothetical protein
LDKREASGTVEPQVYQAVHQDLARELAELEDRQANAEEIEASIREDQRLELTRQVLQLRKDAVQRAFAEEHISERVARRLIGELDASIHELMGR